LGFILLDIRFIKQDCPAITEKGIEHVH